MATQAAPVPDHRIELVGAWLTFDSRKLDVIVRVTSRKVTGPYARVSSTAEYRVGKAPPGTDPDTLAVWTFDKTLPDERHYNVALHQGGKLSCDCPGHIYRKPDSPVLCAHISTVMTLADAFKELILPLPPAPEGNTGPNSGPHTPAPEGETP